MPRKYTLDLTNIKTDSSEKYYWLGFIAGDSSVAKNEARIRIELKDIDLPHLIKFQNFMGSNTPITERTNNVGCHACTVNINSAELKRYLIQYNIVPNKTNTFTMPLDNIPSQYLWDFVRGLVDADGCLHIRKNRNNLPILTFTSANKECTEQMAKIWDSTNKLSIKNNEGNKALNILHKMYETSTEETRLDRKFELYRSLIE